MTHDDHSTAFDSVLHLLVDHGFDGMAEAITVLLNEAMKLERSEAINAAPYERTSERRGYANGFKPKAVNSRLGVVVHRLSVARQGGLITPCLAGAGHRELPIRPLKENSHLVGRGMATANNYNGDISGSHRATECVETNLKRISSRCRCPAAGPKSHGTRY